MEDIDRLQISTASVSTVAVFDTVRQSLNSETVAKIGASYHFAVDGSTLDCVNETPLVSLIYSTVICKANSVSYSLSCVLQVTGC